MSMGNNMETLSMTYHEWVHPEWVKGVLHTRARSEMDEDKGESKVTTEHYGPLVEYFQSLVERDFIVLWAETDYEVTFSGESFSIDKSGKLNKSVKVEFTFVTDRYFHRPREVEI